MEQIPFCTLVPGEVAHSHYQAYKGKMPIIRFDVDVANSVAIDLEIGLSR